MARSTAEIQADIAVTRRLIEGQLDGIRRRLPDRWWVPYAVLGGALVTGLLISRVSVFRLVGTGARAVEASLAVASTVGAVERFRKQQHPARQEAA